MLKDEINIKNIALNCVGLKKDEFGDRKCSIHDVSCYNFLCDSKCCILDCDRESCEYNKPCKYIRVFNTEKGKIKIFDIEKGSFKKEE